MEGCIASVVLHISNNLFSKQELSEMWIHQSISQELSTYCCVFSSFDRNQQDAINKIVAVILVSNVSSQDFLREAVSWILSSCNKTTNHMHYFTTYLTLSRSEQNIHTSEIIINFIYFLRNPTHTLFQPSFCLKNFFCDFKTHIYFLM